MGGYITGKPTKKDPELLEELHKITLEDVNKTKLYFDQYYPETFKIDFMMFEEVISNYKY